MTWELIILNLFFSFSCLDSLPEVHLFVETHKVNHLINNLANCLF
jgi:hypothetical protein